MLKLFYLSAVVIAIVSCKKEICQGNCEEIRIAGRVVDSSNTKGLANIPIQVYWQDRGICYQCPEIDVSSKKTDKDGNFGFTVSIDTSRFGRYALYLATPIPNGYIPDDYLGQPINQENKLRESLFSYTPNFHNIRFVVYQKSNLDIQLQRTQNDIFTRFDLDYYYNFTHLGLYTYTGSPPVSITSFRVVTAANLATKIIWTKGYGLDKHQHL